MSYTFPPDLADLVQQKMAGGGYPSEDDLLRAALRALTDEEDDLAAIQAAIAERDNGDPGEPVEKVFAELRKEVGLPPRS